MAARAPLPLRRLLHRSASLLRSGRAVHTGAAAAAAVVREPRYPPVVPSLTAKSKSARRRQVEEYHGRVRAADAEEKLRLLTKIQRRKYVLHPQTSARNADRWYQSFTKTAYVPGLPGKFTQPCVARSVPAGEQGESPLAAAAAAAARDAAPAAGEQRAAEAAEEEEALAEVRSLAVQATLQEHWFMRKRKAFLYREQEHLMAPFLRNLVAGVTQGVARHNPLLLRSSLDVSPQVCFYWARGSRTIPRGHRSGRKEPIRFQIDDKPHSQIRIPQQLPQFAPMESSYAAEIPEVKESPDMMPLFKRQYENNVFTGAKLPDPACYGHTQFHLVPDFSRRDRMAKRQAEDHVEVFLRANAVGSLFCWTAAQAMYQGFWSGEDVTRPFASQAVITDGQFFSFFCYQLNTLALSADADADNPRKNVLWGTESLRLYEGVRDGEVVGLDDGVLRLLFRFLMNRP